LNYSDSTDDEVITTTATTYTPTVTTSPGTTFYLLSIFPFTCIHEIKLS